jgi:hypothetical protein
MRGILFDVFAERKARKTGPVHYQFILTGTPWSDR